jgi:hypothetical protein
MTLAQHGAKKAIKKKLTAEGRRVAYMEAKDISALAKAYLQSHPAELIADAAEAIASYGPLLKLAKAEARDRQRAGKRARELSDRKAPFHAGSRGH